jgi:hypothetical protein
MSSTMQESGVSTSRSPYRSWSLFPGYQYSPDLEYTSSLMALPICHMPSSPLWPYSNAVSGDQSHHKKARRLSARRIGRVRSCIWNILLYSPCIPSGNIPVRAVMGGEERYSGRRLCAAPLHGGWEGACSYIRWIALIDLAPSPLRDPSNSSLHLLHLRYYPPPHHHP